MKGLDFHKIKILPLTGILIMAILSFTNLLGIKIAGLAVITGVAFFFIDNYKEKQALENNGLNFSGIIKDMSRKKIWIWFILPILMDAVSITIGKLFLPGYIDHVTLRASSFVSFEINLFSLFQLMFLALGEEIAWRAFFQPQLNKVFPILPVLIISSILFAIGHFNSGNITIVLYDIFFVFINSLLYGVIFYKTNNAWISSLSHFVANLFSIIVFSII